MAENLEQVTGRVFLVVVDESPEMRNALRYACRRAKRTGGRVALLYVMLPPEGQQWGAVVDLMRQEARQQAEEVVARYAGRTGADVSGLDFFVALALWKLACIAEGVYARYTAGVMGDDGADVIDTFGEIARDAAGRDDAPQQPRSRNALVQPQQLLTNPRAVRLRDGEPGVVGDHPEVRLVFPAVHARPSQQRNLRQPHRRRPGHVRRRRP